MKDIFVLTVLIFCALFAALYGVLKLWEGYAEIISIGLFLLIIIPTLMFFGAKRPRP